MTTLQTDARAIDRTDRTEPGGAPPVSRTHRSEALDRLRGVALVAMLVHHLIDWMTGDARRILPGWERFAVTDAAAVAFFVAAGGSMALFVASRRARGLPRWRIAAQVLRRYGMLVPIGVTLGWALWRDPRMFGVLEVLGTAVVAAAAVSAVVPRRLTPLAAAGALWAGMWLERALEGDPSWLADEVLAGKFPLVTYLGFVLVGVAAVRTGWYRDRRLVLVGVVAGTVATLVLLAGGTEPARYPGQLAFVVPGLTITVVAYALGQRSWARLHLLDRVIRRAAAHTLGIFVAHYGIYAALRWAGLLGEVPAPVAVAVALVVTTGICLVAPRVPQLPWSLRTDRRVGPRAGGALTSPACPTPGDRTAAPTTSAS